MGLGSNGRFKSFLRDGRWGKHEEKTGEIEGQALPIFQSQREKDRKREEEGEREGGRKGVTLGLLYLFLCDFIRFYFKWQG